MRRTPTRRTGAPPDSPHSNTARSSRRVFTLKENVMGKYFVGWILGVPAIVLVVLWFFFR